LQRTDVIHVVRNLDLLQYRVFQEWWRGNVEHTIRDEDVDNEKQTFAETSEEIIPEKESKGQAG